MRKRISDWWFRITPRFRWYSSKRIKKQHRGTPHYGFATWTAHHQHFAIDFYFGRSVFVIWWDISH